MDSGNRVGGYSHLLNSLVRASLGVNSRDGGLDRREDGEKQNVTRNKRRVIPYAKHSLIDMACGWSDSRPANNASGGLSDVLDCTARWKRPKMSLQDQSTRWVHVMGQISLRVQLGTAILPVQLSTRNVRNTERNLKPEIPLNPVPYE